MVLLADGVFTDGPVARIGGFSDDEMKALDEKASRLVDDHEVGIRAVAKRLNLCGRLRGAQVSEIAAAARATGNGESTA